MRPALLVITTISIAWGVTRGTQVKVVAVPMPLPVAVVPPPAPEPPPAPAPPVAVPAPSPAPRTLAPRLFAACVMTDPTVFPPDEQAPDNPACRWDEGFPAISRSGDLVAIKTYASEEMTGEPIGIEIALVDTRTQKITKRLVLAHKDKPDAIQARVAQAQRALEGYRTLVRLDERGPLRAETAEDVRSVQVRVLDTASNTTLWQEELAVAGDAYGMRGAALHVDGIWYDDELRTVFGMTDVGDGHGPGVTEYFVRTLPRR
jgi:hypothetical protein